MEDEIRELQSKLRKLRVMHGEISDEIQKIERETSTVASMNEMRRGFLGANRWLIHAVPGPLGFALDMADLGLNAFSNFKSLTSISKINELMEERSSIEKLIREGESLIDDLRYSESL